MGNTKNHTAPLVVYRPLSKASYVTIKKTASNARWLKSRMLFVSRFLAINVKKTVIELETKYKSPDFSEIKKYKNKEEGNPKKSEIHEKWINANSVRSFSFSSWIPSGKKYANMYLIAGRYIENGFLFSGIQSSTIVRISLYRHYSENKDSSHSIDVLFVQCLERSALQG
tara:strand:- start:16943 stop:17452 length:510 start_codon:yes stop_codon:yes gene_type:complete